MPTRLGQNFLTNENVAEKIAESANIAGANVLEIGPGKGILTKYLTEYARKVLAVEIDKKLAESLRRDALNASPAEKRRTACVSTTDKLKIINGDILKINLPELIEENNFQDYKVVANLPYYITSKIIRLFLETKYPPTEMILMVQKEVGERIVALDGKESILSISVKFYADPKILFDVPKEKFSPVPKVHSAVIKIKCKDTIPNVDVTKLFFLVRAGFSAKRKTLGNNLANGFHLPKEKIAEILKKTGLDPAVRAERLSLENWLKLYELSSRGSDD